MDKTISSQARRAEHKQALRQSILDAAAKLFVNDGYDAVSMRRIAEQIGYTPTTIYLHFAGKDEILFALLDEGYGRLGVQLAEAAASQVDPLRRIEVVGRAYIAFGLGNPMHYQLMFMRRADFLVAKLAERREGRPDAFGVLQVAVQAAQDAHTIRPGDALTHSTALWAVVHGVVALAIALPVFDPAFVQQVTDLTLAAYLEGLSHV